MPRKAREFSTTNVYHIIFRGNDKQDIFYDDQDRMVFLDRIEETKKKFNYEVFTYCLMDNHVHMIIRVKDKFLSKSMHSLGTRYSVYFNKKCDRTGHVFENRFFSKKIETLNYFLNVCKYVHRNPESANMELTQNYQWSSFKFYLGKKGSIIDKHILLHYFNDDIEEFKKFTLNNDDREQMMNMLDYEIMTKFSEGELADLIKRRYELDNASDVSLLGKIEKEKIIKELKELNKTSLSQLSRVTRISKYNIKKIWNE